MPFAITARSLGPTQITLYHAMDESLTNGSDHLIGKRSLGETLTDNPEGFRLTHTMVRISDPERSLNFYTGLLRMTMLFRTNLGPCTIYYLGYPDDADRSPQDVLSKGAKTGLLELIHVASAAAHEGSKQGPSRPMSSLGHLGFKVRNVSSILEAARRGGWKVLKATSEIPKVAVGIHEDIESEGLHPSFLKTYEQIGFIEDPDG